MIGQLTQEQIEDVLKAEAIGRIGCHANNQTYITPVTYVYENNSIYGHTDYGMKVRLMRENPNVCFEVEQIRSMANWRSVIAWGTYRELSGDDADKARILLIRRLLPLLLSTTSGPHLRGDSYADYRIHSSGAHGLFYEIDLHSKTGRFESPGE